MIPAASAASLYHHLCEALPLVQGSMEGCCWATGNAGEQDQCRTGDQHGGVTLKTQCRNPHAQQHSALGALCRGIYIIRPVLAVTQLSQPNFMFVKAFGEWALDREQHKYLEWLTFMYCCFFIITRTPGRPSSGDGKSWQKVHSLELLVFCVFFSPPTAVKIIDLWDKWQEHS